MHKLLIAGTHKFNSIEFEFSCIKRALITNCSHDVNISGHS